MLVRTVVLRENQVNVYLEILYCINLIFFLNAEISQNSII